MEYITLIKEFYNLVESNSLTTGQIALWHALVYINNKSFWKEYFSVPNITLQLYTGLSRQGIIKARNVLKQKGLIDFSDGKRGQSPTYKINRMVNSLPISSQIVDTSVDKWLTNSLHKSSALKDNKTKDKDNINPIIPFEGELGTSVSEWLRYKSERGQAYKQTGLNALYKKIRAAVDDIGERAVISAISKSISNNWQGLFFDRRNNKSDADDCDNYAYSELEAALRDKEGY